MDKEYLTRRFHRIPPAWRMFGETTKMKVWIEMPRTVSPGRGVLGISTPVAYQGLIGVGVAKRRNGGEGMAMALMDEEEVL